MKNIKWILIFLCFFPCLWLVSVSQFQRVPATKAVFLSVKGGIGPAVQEFIQQGLQKAKQESATVVILQLNTPGGLSESMREIIEDILTSPVPIITYVAPSGARAASAGTYILYASHIAAMAPGTNIGAATPIHLGMPNRSSDKDNKSAKPDVSEKKVINDARAYIRSLAQLRGRNVEWAEKAVTQGESLSANEALKMKVIDVVANNVQDLLQQVNGKIVSVDGKPFKLQTQNLSIVNYEANWKTKFLMTITDPTVAYILLLIGFYGILFEFMSPGFILPGTIGAISLIVALYALRLLPINYAGLALLLLGLAFLVAEVFMPSGVLAIGGVISFVLGSLFLLKPGTGYIGIPWWLIIAFAILTLIFVIGVLQLAWRSRRKKVVSGVENMLNAEGVVMRKNHYFWVQIEGELWKAESQDPLEPGQRVVVTEVKNLVLIVKRKE